MGNHCGGRGGSSASWIALDAALAPHAHPGRELNSDNNPSATRFRTRSDINTDSPVGGKEFSAGFRAESSNLHGTVKVSRSRGKFSAAKQNRLTECASICIGDRRRTSARRDKCRF